jgi:hypothetical protein
MLAGMNLRKALMMTLDVTNTALRAADITSAVSS